MRATADRARIEKLLAVARSTRPVVDGEGNLFHSSNVAGHAQVYVQSRPGRERRLVLASDDRMVPEAQTPLGLLVRADHGGNETWQLGMLAGGEYRELTTDAKAIHQSVTIHPDGRRIGLAWNPGGQADMVLGELDLATGTQTRWAEPGGYWSWGAWSPAGDRAAVVKVMGTPTEAHIVERDGTMTRLLADALRAVPVAWSDKGILVLTDLGRDFLGLAVVDPASPGGIERWLFAEEHDVDGVAVDAARRRAAIVVNEGVRDGIRCLDLATGETVDRTKLPPGVVIGDHTGDAGYHLSWAPDGQRLFVAWETATQPAEIYEWPGAVRWTHTMELPPDLVEPVETSYRSFDGLEIPALHYRVDGTPRPTVVQFHGGPEGQARAGFMPLAHLLNAAGIDLLMPNVRGSTGYGMRYQSLDDKTLRWNGVRDGCEAARHLTRTHQATKIAAEGGSYGGFMTLAVLVEDPDLWDAGVDVVGIADWHTFFDNMPPWRGVLRINEYGDPNGAEAGFLHDISPIRQAAKIKAPLLVIHGRNDPRVPLEESEQIAHAAPRSELMVFDDEGHGIAKLKNQVTANTRMLEFLVEHLA